MAVVPVGVRKTRKKVLARDDQDAPFFQPLVQRLRTDGQALEPKPQENSPFRFVDAHRITLQQPLHLGHRLLRFVPVKGLDVFTAQADEFAALHQFFGQCRAKACGAQVDDRIDCPQRFD